MALSVVEVVAPWVGFGVAVDASAERGAREVAGLAAFGDGGVEGGVVDGEPLDAVGVMVGGMRRPSARGDDGRRRRPCVRRVSLADDAGLDAGEDGEREPAFGAPDKLGEVEVGALARDVAGEVVEVEEGGAYFVEVVDGADGREVDGATASATDGVDVERDARRLAFAMEGRKVAKLGGIGVLL